MTKRSTAVRSDIKERRRQIFTEERTSIGSFESDDGVAAEEELSFEASADQLRHLHDQLENRSRGLNNQPESDYSDMSVAQPRAYSVQLPILNEDHVDDFLELEAKFKTAFDEEGCAEASASSVGGGDNQARGGLGLRGGGALGRGGHRGGGGATGARNALLSGTKSSPRLKTRSYSLQTPAILEGMASSSPAPFFNFSLSSNLGFQNVCQNIYFHTVNLVFRIVSVVFFMTYFLFGMICLVFKWCIWHLGYLF